MSISDRSITIGGEIFALETGQNYNVLSDDLAENWAVKFSQKIPNTE